MKDNAAIVQEFRDKFGCCDGKDKSATCQCRAELKFLRTHLNAKDELIKKARQEGRNEAVDYIEKHGQYESSKHTLVPNSYLDNARNPQHHD